MVYSSLGPDGMILIINRIFQRGVTLCQTECTQKSVLFNNGFCGQDIVMAFSPQNIVGCLLKKRVTKGGSRTPEDPLATPLIKFNNYCPAFFSTIQYNSH